MKILFITLGYKPAYRLGGPILSVSALAEELVKRGNEVSVVTTNSNLDQDLDVPLNIDVDINGVSVRYFKRKEFLSSLFPFIPYLSKTSGFVYAPGMKEYLSNVISDFDLVHTHLPFIYPTFIASRIAKKHNKPLFYHQRGVLDPNRLSFRSLKKRLYVRAVELSILKQATTLIALTKEEVDSYKALVIDRPCRIVPNGVDYSRYRQRPLTEPLGIPRDSMMVLFMGRIHPIKGADKLLEAFICIHEQVQDSVLVMAGPDEFDLEARFMKMAEKHGLSKKIFFPGMVAGELKLDLLARADLFCLPSVAEGFSMAILEALASGTPVLISTGCNFSEVQSAGAGTVVKNDSSLIATSLLSLLSDRHMLHKMGRRGIDLVKKDYSWGRIADKMTDIYEEGIHRYCSKS